MKASVKLGQVVKDSKLHLRTNITTKNRYKIK